MMRGVGVAAAAAAGFAIVGPASSSPHASVANKSNSVPAESSEVLMHECSWLLVPVLSGKASPSFGPFQVLSF